MTSRYLKTHLFWKQRHLVLVISSPTRNQHLVVEIELRPLVGLEGYRKYHHFALMVPGDGKEVGYYIDIYIYRYNYNK